MDGATRGTAAVKTVVAARFEAAPITFDPGPGIVGKSVRIYVDAGDKARYQVMLEPVLAGLSKGNER